MWQKNLAIKTTSYHVVNAIIHFPTTGMHTSLTWPDCIFPFVLGRGGPNTKGKRRSGYARLDAYLLKNQHEPYSAKMVPMTKILVSGSWTIGLVRFSMLNAFQSSKQVVITVLKFTLIL